MRSKVPRPFGWWVKKYEERCGSLTFEEREELFYDPCRGFMVWAVSPDMKALIVGNICGDGLYWRNVGLAMFKRAHNEYGVEALRFPTRRDPEAYKRFFGTKGLRLEKTTEVNGRPMYWLRLDWSDDNE